MFIADCRLQDGLGCENISKVVDRLVAPLHAIPVGRILFITYCSSGPHSCASRRRWMLPYPIFHLSGPQTCRDECKSLPIMSLIRSRTISTFRYTFINCIVYPQHAGSLAGHCSRILIAWRHRYCMFDWQTIRKRLSTEPDGRSRHRLLRWQERSSPILDATPKATPTELRPYETPVSV